ncbi:VWA domain-containing protein [Nocardioides sp. MH1]|uniref:VWA domain-containing protein n=1 Tax=Nocardioides sp. MH1 TaxID=3242490 RepID=UPI003522091F
MTHYPFSAVVGADVDAPGGPDPMALALILTTVSPEVGGVLVRGEKGTAKSTIVRALAAVLPAVDGERPRLVELPIGATEDRVLGSIDLEGALAEGRADYQPGLLVKAHRGILYVDEVNLLHDHLVDVLLDAAAMGRVTVERDGISVERDARFVLVGTMNPEEGELRPQLLDRFGLTVEVAAPRDPALRAEVVRRRMAHDADPARFAATYADAEAALEARIAAARKRLPEVTLSDSALLRIAEVCAAFEVDGLRADIVMARTAAAHAAWQGREAVALEDIEVAARLALPHRRRRNPFDSPGLDEDTLDEALGDDLDPEPEPEPDPDPPSPGGSPDDRAAGDSPPPPAQDAPSDAPPPGDGNAAGTTTAGSASTYRTKRFAVRGVGSGTAGRRSRAITETGRRVGARRPEAGTGALHLVETIRAAVPHQVARGRSEGPLVLRPEDLRVAVREGREANLVLFCVDASGSMAARKRMEQVKTAVLSLLLDAYQRRDKVGLVTFRGDRADLALPPTSSVDIAAARLEDLPAGGRTPLAEGLLEATRALERERVRDPRRRALLVVVTDGRATAGQDALGRSRTVAAHLGASGVAAIVVDCESGPMRMGLARVLADHLGAEHVPVAEVSAEALTSVARGGLCA